MRSRKVQTNGVTLSVAEAGEPGAPLVVLCHGFPELAFSWRHQIAALADAGFHVLAPDQRGYGGSDAPDAVEAYTVVELCADVVGLLDSEVGGGAEQAALVGHDFGAVVAWTAPLLHPDRFRAVAGLSLPPVPARRCRRRRRSAGSSGTTSSTSCTSRSRGPPTPNSPPIRRRRCGACSPPPPPVTRPPLCACWLPDPRASWPASPTPAGCPSGSAAGTSTSTSRNSPAPGSPDRSTGIAASTATGS
ncbi:alpha/beta fold hydrolase [Mycolicibacterium pyrenivorans]|uniref:alpha/beta fold hydrolase n=1 Tax=Mycolicibacterium pyrenivorans TaxID=187102 RepID=UPI0035569ACE